MWELVAWCSASETVIIIIRRASLRKPVRPSCLDAFKPYLRERFEKTGLSAVRLLGEIQPMGYGGSIATLRRYLETLRPEKEQLRKLTVRFETPPGYQAQADWA